MCDPQNSNVPVFAEAEWAQLATALSLSPRQMDVIRCMFRGLGRRRTGRELGLAVASVREYRRRACGRLDIRLPGHLMLRILWEFLKGCDAAGCRRLRDPSAAS